MQALDWKDAARDANSRRLLSSTLPVAATRSSAYEKGAVLLRWLVSLEP